MTVCNGNMCCMAAIVKQRKDLSVHIRFLGGFVKLGILPSCKPKPSADCYFDVFRNQLFKLALRLIVVLRIHKLLNFGQWY